MDRVDVFIIGTGTAATAAAVAASDHGASVALAEEWMPGGLCETRGCKPTKALLRAARAVRDARGAADFGIEVSEPRVDFAATMGRVREMVERRSREHAEWLPSRGSLLLGHADIVRPGLIRVVDQAVEYGALVLACGSQPVLPDIDGLTDTPHHTSDTIWGLEEAPASVAILGGGAISVEFATFFAAIGAKVTILERSGRLLPREDDDVCRALGEALGAAGVDIRYGSAVERARGVDGRARLTVRDPDGAATDLDADLLLVATGRRPKLTGYGLEVLGVETTQRGVTIDERAAASAPGVFAAGDVAGRWQLTDVAYHEGWVAGTNAAGGQAVLDERIVPRAIFSYPEIGSVGLTETQAREQWGDATVVGTAPMSRVGKAQVDGETFGFAKVIADSDGTVVGGHIIGGPAAEVIQVVAMAMLGGVRLDELKRYIPIHPTFGEAVNIASLHAR